jgi:hypothetical protein
MWPVTDSQLHQSLAVTFRIQVFKSIFLGMTIKKERAMEDKETAQELFLDSDSDRCRHLRKGTII